MANGNGIPSPIANLIPSAINLLLMLVIGMLAWWNVQQNTRLTLAEDKANTQSLIVRDLYTWNEAYKTDHGMLAMLYTDFHSNIKTVEQLVSLMREMKDFITNVSVQQIALRETVLRIEQQTLPMAPRRR